MVKQMFSLSNVLLISVENCRTEMTQCYCGPFRGTKEDLVSVTGLAMRRRTSSSGRWESDNNIRNPQLVGHSLRWLTVAWLQRSVLVWCPILSPPSSSPIYYVLVVIICDFLPLFLCRQK